MSSMIYKQQKQQQLRKHKYLHVVFTPQKSLWEFLNTRDPVLSLLFRFQDVLPSKPQHKIIPSTTLFPLITSPNFPESINELNVPF